MASYSRDRADDGHAGGAAGTHRGERTGHLGQTDETFCQLAVEATSADASDERSPLVVAEDQPRSVGVLRVPYGHDLGQLQGNIYAVATAAAMSPSYFSASSSRRSRQI